MGVLSFDEILQADDLHPFTVPTPEWGGEVRMLPMDGTDRDLWDAEQSKKKYPRDDRGNLLEGDWRGLRAFAVARQMVDDNGDRRAVTDADVLALSKKSGKALDRCFVKLQEKSGLLADALEDSEKN